MFRSTVILTAGLLTAFAPFSVRAPEAGAHVLPAVLDAAPFHLTLRRSAPANRTTVEPPTEIRLWFSERPQNGATSVTLIGPSGDRLGTGDVTADEDDDTVYFVQPEAPLAAGAHRVAWRTMAQDGHVIRGEFTFTVAAERVGS